MDPLYSKTIKASGRTYFIDVKEAKNKSKFLTIAESKLSKEGEKKFKRSSIMIFEDQFGKFRDALDDAIKSLQK